MRSAGVSVHYVVFFGSMVFGFFPRSEEAHEVAAVFGGRASVSEAEGKMPSNAELAGLPAAQEPAPANDNASEERARKLKLLEPARAVAHPVLRARQSRQHLPLVVGGGR